MVLDHRLGTEKRNEFTHIRKQKTLFIHSFIHSFFVTPYRKAGHAYKTYDSKTIKKYMRNMANTEVG